MQNDNKFSGFFGRLLLAETMGTLLLPLAIYKVPDTPSAGRQSFGDSSLVGS